MPSSYVPPALQLTEVVHVTLDWDSLSQAKRPSKCLLGFGAHPPLEGFWGNSAVLSGTKQDTEQRDLATLETISDKI